MKGKQRKEYGNMKGKWKKIISVMLALAMVLTTITYTPKQAKADTTWTTESGSKPTFGNTVGTLNNYVRYSGVSATASEDNNGLVPSNAIDNNGGTRWAAEDHENGNYITVDLTASYPVEKVYISWEVASAKEYKIQVSNDGTTFTDAADITIETTYTNRVDKVTLNSAVYARYVRIYTVSRSSESYGVSIWEMGIYGTSDEAVGTASSSGAYSNTTDNSGKGWKTTFASTDDGLNNYVSFSKYRSATATASKYSSSFDASRAIDGNVDSCSDGKDSRWAAENNENGNYITINLGAEYNISKVFISWETAKAKIYNIETSNDGVNFDTAATVAWTGDNIWTDNYRVDKISLNSQVKAQYVRIYTVERAVSQYGTSIWEIGIYGSDSEIDHTYTTSAFSGYSSTSGNKIEAESFSTDISHDVETNSNSNLSNSGNLGHSIAGSVAGYKVYFDRKTSNVKLRYSAKSSSAAGNIKMYVDSLSGTPVATIATTATGGDNWDTYTDVSANVEIEQGDHKIYLVFEPSSGMTYVANIDYFQFSFEPEDVEGEHQAENAHAYEIGSESASHTVVDLGNADSDKAVGTMNTLASNNNPAYLTTYVNVDYSGLYKFNIKYTTTTATTIGYRINDSANWSTVSVDAGSSWNEIKEKIVTAELQLDSGINKIDITGVLDSGDTVDEWINIDSFEMSLQSYGKVAFEERNRNSTTLGNEIQAEDYDNHDTVTIGTDSNCSGGKKLSNSKDGAWAQYNVYFDRKASGINFKYSSPSGNGGNIEVYVDSMDGNPATTVTVDQDTNDWVTYKTDLTGDIVIPSGRHKIFIKFVPASGYTDVADIDWFKFDYTPQEVDVKDEAENAHTYIQGSASETYNVQEDGNFSNGKAIANMNTWPDNGRAYMTTYVKADHPGQYKLTIAYATANAQATNIDYRINGTDDTSWTSLTAASTGGWNTVKTLTTTVTLERGINIIDITGASNVYYADGQDWQYANIDYFKLERVIDETNIAYGKPATAGTSQTGYPVENAVDGDDGTRWADNDKTNWMQIDLQGMYEIESLRLLFERAYPVDFDIQVSRDGETWITARTVTNFNSGADIGSGGATIEWTSEGVCLGKAAYIRIKSSKVYNNYGLSIYEFEVRGEKVSAELSDAALNKTASSNSSESVNGVEKAVDGKDTTRWASLNGEANPWYEVNLGKEYEIHSVDLKFERAYPKSFRIQVSDDGETWTDAHTEAAWTEPGTASGISSDKMLGYSFHLDSVKASYVRFYVDEKANSGWGISMYEMEVWAKDLSKSDYWANQSSKTYGVYPVSGLQDTLNGDTIDSSLVQGNVIATGDTYEVVYESGKEMYFFINPYGYKINYDTDSVFWSCGNSGNDLWGASEHNDNLVKYVSKQQATVKYVLPDSLDFGTADYITTEVACQVYATSDISEGVPIEGKTAKYTLVYKVKVLKSHDIYINDTIRTNGCLAVRDPESGASYEWQKSDNGSTGWTSVSSTRYDLTILNNNGQSVNVAMDLGGGKYYKVRKSGTEEWSQPYEIPYFNNIQNGDFEAPAMFSPDEGETFAFDSKAGDEQQYPNGYKDLVWKTTGPGWNGKVGHDIEIVNARNLKVDQSGQEYQFSVTLDEMYGNNSHGDQFAELNCENVGALYQDILTTPGSECYWDLDHAGRWNQNTMYVVAMSSQDAQDYTTKTQVAQIVSAAAAEGLSDTGASDYSSQTQITLDNGVKAYVWKVMSPETCGIWAHHTGKYSVPEGDSNYLTRFFFVSEGGAKRKETDTANETVGNLLDNITFEMKQSYSIEYYVDGVKQDGATVSGISEPYARVTVPSSISGVTLSNYTLSNAEMGGSSAESFNPYYLDTASGKMTIAYNHNNLKLYYESGIVAVTKKLEGVSEVPSNYSLTVKVQSTDGATTYHTQTLSASDFTKVDKVNSSDPDSYFATFKFSASGMNSGTTYKVTEVVPTPKITIGGTLKNYMYNANMNGTSTAVPLSDIDNTNLSYAGTFVYDVSADNQVTLTNQYKSTHQVTANKIVTGNMGDTTKAFNFNIAITKDSAAVNAAGVGSGATSTGTGTYGFSLSHNGSMVFTLYDGCNATITESDYSGDYYATTWRIKDDSSAPSTSSSITLSNVQDDITAICTNDNNDLGDVEVQGFQMNTNSAEGAPSEFNPSFRVVCRVSKNTIGRKAVTSYGVIYGLTSELGDVNLKDTLQLNSSNEYVYTHQTTETGVYKNWTTQDQYSEKYWNYYALTFVGKVYTFKSLEADMSFRAYAILADGSVAYGDNIYTVNMYEIADNLYQNQKLSTKASHEFLYTNVLNLVNISNNRRNIGQAIMAALEVDSSDKTKEDYILANGVYRDMLNYVYCQQGYTYAGREEFEPKTVDGDVLLGKLNTKTSTSYTTLFDWIYNETENMGNYKGFYKKVPYAWDNGIFKDYKSE